ncbi:AGC family protein kinase [Histomonas meleagridis]|uniref:AGC family protein kinase n=1 Tax=Histomonas meleagridis TaxID=135588 RepID=UPI003559643A|nr:AGC family protein kinase [Histomonas meleagridis]KAH0801930.1 AGC family protein kinase [Histomonas meleagridis]
MDFKPELAGWLRRKNIIGVFTKRYAVLNSTVLTLYKDESCEKLDIQIQIKENTKIQIHDKSNLNRFTITGDSSHTFDFEDEDKMLRWVMAIGSCNVPRSTLSMEQFQVISVIGRGYCGKVMLVQKTDTKERLVIKSIRKSQLIQSRKIHTVLTERNILAKIDFPFIVQLKFAFQSDSKFYIVEEFVPGGELFFYLQRQTFQIEDIKLYIAEIALCLQYLHSNGIVYRDLKPENILIDTEGHIKLTDFGLSKILYESTEMNTFCGTSEYMSPEVMRHENYDNRVDWWSLGILSYELVFHRTPFSNQNRAKLYKNIMECKPQFPLSTPQEFQDFVLMLLEKNPKKRAGFNEVKNSEFMSSVNFDDVLQKRVQPMFVPITESQEVINNFEKEFTDEPPVDSYVNPVHGSGKYFQGFSFSNGNTFVNLVDEPSEASFHSEGPFQDLSE